MIKEIITSKHPDLTHFVRSIQLIEGKLDCFARTTMYCESLDCQWHSYCIKELKKIKGRNHEHSKAIRKKR